MSKHFFDGYEAVKGKELSNDEVKKRVKKLFEPGNLGICKIREQYISAINKKHIIQVYYKCPYGWKLKDEFFQNLVRLSNKSMDVEHNGYYFIIMFR